MAYTDQTKIEKYLQTTIPSSYSSWVTTIASAVTSFIDKYLGKSFVPVTEARYFDGSGDSNLIVDDFTGTPTIAILDDAGAVAYTLGATDVNLYPLNTSVKNIIHLSGTGSYGSRYRTGSKRVKVTAAFGYASVPDDITLAATIMAAKVYSNGNSDGQVSSESLGDYSITYKAVEDSNITDPTATNILNLYKDIEI